MDKWEYLKIDIYSNSKQFSMTIYTWTTSGVTKSKDPYKNTVEAFNKLGELGWELATAINDGTYVGYVMKRRVS